MKKTKFTEEQILFALKQGSAGQPVADICRQMGISEATYYVWKKRYADMGLLEVRELRQLRDENARLKRLVADLTLDRHVLQEVIKKRFRDRQTTGDRTMDPRLFPDEHTAFLCAQLPAQRDLVLPVPGPRQQRAETAPAGAGHGPTPIWIRATAYSADPGRLEGGSEPGAPTVQARGAPGAYESPSPEADQSPPRAGTCGNIRWAVLGDGLRA